MSYFIKENQKILIQKDELQTLSKKIFFKKIKIPKDV